MGPKDMAPCTRGLLSTLEAAQGIGTQDAWHRMQGSGPGTGHWKGPPADIAVGYRTHDYFPPQPVCSLSPASSLSLSLPLSLPLAAAAVAPLAPLAAAAAAALAALGIAPVPAHKLGARAPIVAAGAALPAMPPRPPGTVAAAGGGEVFARVTVQDGDREGGDPYTFTHNQCYVLDLRPYIEYGRMGTRTKRLAVRTRSTEQALTHPQSRSQARTQQMHACLFSSFFVNVLCKLSL